jgi:hypothetical protein
MILKRIFCLVVVAFLTFIPLFFAYKYKNRKKLLSEEKANKY